MYMYMSSIHCHVTAARTDRVELEVGYFRSETNNGLGVKSVTDHESESGACSAPGVPVFDGGPPERVVLPVSVRRQPSSWTERAASMVGMSHRRDRERWVKVVNGT
jgi:hypothetical protein